MYAEEFARVGRLALCTIKKDAVEKASLEMARGLCVVGRAGPT